MSQVIFLATDDGVSIWARDHGDYLRKDRHLAGIHVTCISACGKSIVAGTTQGIYRSDNGGQRWQESSSGLSLPHLRWVSHNPEDPQSVLAGTEPAGIFISRDAGRTWLERGEVGQFRDDGEWYLPYSPEDGCIRDFAFHGDYAYAAVEVGGMLASADSGTNWNLIEGCTGTPDMPAPPTMLHPDVHSVITHPSSADLISACCGGGFYRSTDRGKSWGKIYDCYCRAAWIHPSDPNHIVLGPADDVSQNGRVEVTRDGGKTWTETSGNLSSPWAERMVERFLPLPDELLAILSDGEILLRKSDGGDWVSGFSESAPVNAAATTSFE